MAGYNPKVFNAIASKYGYAGNLAADPLEEIDPEGDRTPYDTVAQAGTADPVEAPEMPEADMGAGAPYESRQLQAEGNLISNMGRSFANAARGANAPSDNSALFNSIDSQNASLVKQGTQDLDRRNKVMQAIMAQKAKAQAAAEAARAKENATKATIDERENFRKSYDKRTEAMANNAGSRLDNSAIRAANGLMSDTNIKRETNKLNMARSAGKLLEEIRDGKLVDSKNISKQLTNMIAVIEMGSPGGVSDREAMGVDTLYSRLKDTMGYVSGNPQRRIPEEYLSQLESEVNALGDRAAKNYHSMVEGKLGGSDLSMGNPDADPGRVHGLVKQSKTAFMKQNGYDPETGEPIGRKPHGAPKSALTPEQQKRLAELRAKAGQ